MGYVPVQPYEKDLVRSGSSIKGEGGLICLNRGLKVVKEGGGMVKPPMYLELIIIFIAKYESIFILIHHKMQNAS